MAIIGRCSLVAVGLGVLASHNRGLGDDNVAGNMILRPVERADIPLTVAWRNDPDARASLRTPYALNIDQQERFFQDVICDRHSLHRYWIAEAMGIGRAVAIVGLTNLQWENRIAEVSLVVDPAKRGHGYGALALAAVMREGFCNLGLLTICGEAYQTNPALAFWEKMIERYQGTSVILPRRKWWGGQLHDAVYFTFAAEQTLPLLEAQEAA